MTTTTFTYGLRARPPAIGAVPRGFESWIPNENVSDVIKSEWHQNFYRHGVLIYLKELTATEISSYELVDMNVKPIETLWIAFVELCETLNDYEIDFKDFMADYMGPDGELRMNNPLHSLELNGVFSILESKGYAGSLEGLEAFYNQA